MDISCCGTVCNECNTYNKICVGCNKSEGKPFHCISKKCPIYECVCNKKYSSCIECDKIPCEIWKTFRDPKYTDEEFENNIENRINVLKSH